MDFVEGGNAVGDFSEARALACHQCACSSPGWSVCSVVHAWREWRAANASTPQSYVAVQDWGPSEVEEEAGTEDWSFQMLFKIPYEIIFGPVLVPSCTWVSSEVPELLGKSTPKSRPVQCE